jgi:FKBP-type peptidyl-prolyl cis-trans isomerase FkpA
MERARIVRVLVAAAIAAVAASQAGCGDREIEVSLEGGLEFEDLRPGTGRPAENGSYVEVHYRATLPSGRVIIDTYALREAHKFTVGDGTVIPGMDAAVRGMRSGGKRVVRVPPHAHYGRLGFGDTIPPGTTLVFEIEAMRVHERPPPYHPKYDLVHEEMVRDRGME